MSDLNELHKLLAEELKARLLSGECSPAELNVIRQFLRDNHIDGLPAEGSALGDIVAELPEHLRKYAQERH